MKNKHIISCLNGIQELSNKGGLKLAYALKKNEKYLRSELELIKSTLPEPPKQYTKQQEDIQKIADGVNADKNIPANQKQVEFEKLVEDYRGQHKEVAKVIDEYEAKLQELNETEYQGKKYGIKFDYLPEDITKAQLDMIEWLVDWPEESEEYDKKEVGEKE